MTASYLGEVDQDDPEYETDTGEQDDVARNAKWCAQTKNKGLTPAPTYGA